MRAITYAVCISIVSFAQADEFASCSEIESDAARLKCYDETNNRSNPKDSQSPPEAGPDMAGAQDQETEQAVTANPSEDLFGKSIEDVSAALAETAGVEEIDQMHATVVRASQDALGRYVVVLDNEQRWRQIRRDRFQVEAGDAVLIRRAALGSFSMQRQSGGRKTKVRRID